MRKDTVHMALKGSRRRLLLAVAWGVSALMMLLPLDLSATHIIGGDIEYSCLGNSLYEIRLTVRRDCFLGAPNAQFDDPASIAFFNGATFQRVTFVGVNGQLLIPFNDDDTLNQTFISDCTISGNDVCVQQTTYVDTVLLPFLDDGYILAYQRCCRNNTLQNIVNPLGTGMTLVTIISAEAQLTCNSSPILAEYPPIYICVDDSIDWDFSVEFDPDGDSIIYELFTPFEGATLLNPRPQPPSNPPYDTVVWNNPPYSLENLLGGVPLQIDRFTGQMTGMPNTVGQFLAGVRIFSYRDGLLIEITSIEWQYNVRACRDVPVADFNVSTELNCENLTLQFEDNSENALEYTWYFDYPDPASAVSNDPNVEFTFDEEGFYTVALIVNDPDSICFDTAMREIGVFNSELAAEFDIDVVECEDSIVAQIVDLSIEPNSDFDIVAWEWILAHPDTTVTDTNQNPIFTFDSTTNNLMLDLTVTSANGCTASTSLAFDVNIINIPFKGGGEDTIGVCDGDTVALFDMPGNSAYIWTWADDPTLDASDPTNPLAFPHETTAYFVTVTDGLCVVEGDVLVVVQDLPELDFDVATDCRSLEVDITNNSTGFQYLWDFGDGNMSTDEDPVHIYDQPGNYLITLSSADGCDVDTGYVITVAAIQDSVDDFSLSCFGEPVELNPDGSAEYIYEWEPADGLDDETSPTPIAEVDQTTTFYVTITDAQFTDCFVIDSAEVFVPDDFDLSGPADTSYCGAPEITLTAGNDDLVYEWYNADDELIGTGPDLTVQPVDTTTYYLVGSDSYGCMKSDTFTLSPAYFAIDVSPDLVICEGDDTTIFVINQDPNQDLEYLWEPSEFIIGPNDVANPRVLPDGNQTFTVEITNNTLGCMLEEEVTVLVSDFDYDILRDELICLGDMVMLTFVNNDTTNLSFQWTPTETIVEGEDTATPKVMPDETTLYTVLIQDNNYGCMTSDSVLVEVSWFDPGFLEIFAEPDTIFANSGEVFTISTNQDPDLTYIWSGVGINDPTLPVITAAPTEAGSEYTYSVTVTNEDGCELTGTLNRTLTVVDPFCDDRDVFIPNAFSPNGDGVNDVLLVYGNYITTMELRIFNRWGQEVFYSQNQGQGWDGTFEGEQLTPDVYGYWLKVSCPPNKEFFKKGNITLLR